MARFLEGREVGLAISTHVGLDGDGGRGIVAQMLPEWCGQVVQLVADWRRDALSPRRLLITAAACAVAMRLVRRRSATRRARVATALLAVVSCNAFDLWRRRGLTIPPPQPHLINGSPHSSRGGSARDLCVHEAASLRASTTNLERLL